MILGVLASSRPAAAGDYESIASVTVGSGGTSTISFTSIPSTYTHLQLRGITNVTSDVDIALRFNSDFGSNYSEHYLYGNGTSAVAGGGSNLTQVSTFYAYSSSTDTLAMAPGVFDILDYANTNKYKTIRGLTGPADKDLLVFRSSLWRSTSAVTSITLTTTGTMRQNSSIALYGIKSA